MDSDLADLKKQMGDDMTRWKWGDIHTADFVHPVATTDALKALFRIEPVRRGGDAYTVMAASSPSAAGSRQVSGASFMFVFDVGHWDASQGLSVPGNSAQPVSPHYADLVPYWGEGKYFPLSFSREAVEANAKDRLILQPLRETTAARSTDEPQFEVVDPKRSLMELRSILDWQIAPRLKEVPGVVEINSYGGQLKTYEVELRPEALVAYGLSLQDVFHALQSNNLSAGGG